MVNEEKYFKIISKICEVNHISNDELVEILKKRESKYLLVLFLKKYNCCSEEELKELLNVRTRRSINIIMKKQKKNFS
ncbi:hypothetical protein QJR52_11990 [Clostridium baratii]|uniref:hypothetical protein n=1 Tax=Clostridium baratii TaxID=1561 RepID=UPI0030CCD9F1